MTRHKARRWDAAPLVAGRGSNVAQLFGDDRYELDYFQRRYVWEREQVTKLVQDLSIKFLDEWDPEDAPEEVRSYDSYFLGPFITYRDKSHKYLADGQQRFVSLLLLLIHLRHLLLEQEDDIAAVAVGTAVMSFKHGKTTFAVDVDEYQPCLDALLNNRAFNVDDRPEHIRLIWEAYHHIAESLPESLRGEALAYFADWLLHRVSLVEIDAGYPERAWEVFQSINDRGVHLKPLDHLKGFLLNDALADRRSLEDMWQRMVTQLEQVENGAGFGFIQTVLRARFATFEPGGQGPDLTKATHEWVREYRDKLVPHRKNGDLAALIPSLFVPLSETYRRLLRAKTRLTKGLDAIYFNAENGITQQFDLTMACFQVDDTASIKTQKIQAIANLIDLLVARNGVNNSRYGQDILDGDVARLLPDVRKARNIDGLLMAVAGELDGDFAGVEALRLRESNYQFIYYLLARLTAWLEAGAERGELVDHYLRRVKGKRRFQVEHLFPASNEAYQNLMWEVDEYRRWRSRIGALVLLPDDDNASLGALPLHEKVESYRNHNLLAAALDCSTHKIRGLARLRRFVKEQKLQQDFHPYDPDEPFTELIEQRGRLFRTMCERIWHPERLGLAVSSRPADGGGGRRRSRKAYGVDLEALVRAGYLNSGDVLVGHHRGRTYRAEVLADGRIRTPSGAAFNSPSAAAMDSLNRGSYNGWAFWRHERSGKGIDKLRSDYLEERPGAQSGA